MIVREVVKNDIQQLSMLFNGYRLFYKKDSDLEGAKTFIEDRLKLQDSSIFICENEKGVLMGFTQLYPLFSSTRMKKLWLLNDLFVDKAFRGQGISKLLINRAKQLVKDTNACGFILETGKTNEVGNHLYPSVGMTRNITANFYEWNL